MAHAHQTIRVFVSSTQKDLKDYRAAARNVIGNLEWQPVMMEDFGASPDATVAACRKKIDSCKLMLLILAWRQGWVPSVEQGGNGRDSITSIELAYAREKSIPVLVLLASDRWPGNMWEEDAERRSYVKAFRENLNQPAQFFEDEPITSGGEPMPAFRAKVKEALLSQKDRLLQERDRGPAGGAHVDYFDSARDGLLDGTDIPFLGPRLYGDGPLSPDALTDALLGRDKLEEGHFLATAAEYRERYLGSREHFLRQFGRIIREQTAAASIPAVHDLIVDKAKPPLLVSTTWDMVLESRLEKADRDFVIVAHVVRSFSGEHDGKVVVLRRDAEPEFTSADELPTLKNDVVVYKPVGSPLLNDRLDEDDGVDTVVVTETDHAALLQRLENEKKGIPKRFALKFARKPLLFLGYGLDVWQYRLMMLAYQQTLRIPRRSTTLAVRVPESPLEEVAWKRLNADLVRMEPNAFAERVMAHGQGS